ncbi:hypothetical protein Dimus_003938 [Dionaea muscipula]
MRSILNAVSERGPGFEIAESLLGEGMLDLRGSIALLPRVDSGDRILGAHKEIELRLFYQQLLLEGLDSSPAIHPGQ